MANPTTNYNFAMPTNTDLVKDLPADFEVFGQAVDTQMKTNADAAIAKSLVTTTGDVIYASGASTPARLGIGSTGQVLTVAGGVPTWATSGGAATNWTLLNSGGTALSGSSTITVSGISNQDKLWIFIDAGSSSALNGVIGVRLNGDTGTNYTAVGWNVPTPSSQPNQQLVRGNYSHFQLAYQNQTASTGGGAVLLSGCKSSGVKVAEIKGSSNDSAAEIYNSQGFWNNSASVTSVSAYVTLGNFDGGTLWVYGSSN